MTKEQRIRAQVEMYEARFTVFLKAVGAPVTRENMARIAALLEEECYNR